VLLLACKNLGGESAPVSGRSTPFTFAPTDTPKHHET
jgi:hypothetical protein